MNIAQFQIRPNVYYHMLKAVIHRDLVVWIRYPINAVLGLFISIFLFGIVFYGGTALAGQAIDDSIEGLVIGYFILRLSNQSFTGIDGSIASEASWGTLERHYLTPLGFSPVIFAKAIAILFREFLLTLIVLLVMLVMTNTRLELPVLTVISVATLTVASAFGLGFATGGLSVLYKRIGNLSGLLQFIFVGLVAAPAFDLWWAKFLPLAQGSGLLQRAMKNGTRLWEFDPLALALLLGNAIFYLALGFLIFKITTRRARRLGTLGDY